MVPAAIGHFSASVSRRRCTPLYNKTSHRVQHVFICPSRARNFRDFAPLLLFFRPLCPSLQNPLLCHPVDSYLHLAAEKMPKMTSQILPCARQASDFSPFRFNITATGSSPLFVLSILENFNFPP